jgi:hypothetical protein
LRKVDRRAETGRKKSGDRREKEQRQEGRRLKTGEKESEDRRKRRGNIERRVGTGRKES